MGESLLIATAGHVDHGKSTLVRSLTGTDPDRWQEEKDRGITIDLGFAHHRRNDRVYSFVDVPGHERFIHNMLAGIGCIDGVLLVIAADESIMPQTKEHAIALQYLGVRQVGIVLSKCDLVDPDLLALVNAELDDWLPSLGWADAPRANFTKNDPATGNQVLAILDRFIPKKPTANAAFRMPIDRIFSSPGSGTVVTGAIERGQIVKGDGILVLPHHQASRVRQIQVHGETVDKAQAHQRAAVNVADLHHSNLNRGQVLFMQPGALPRHHILVRLQPFHSWQPNAKHQFHLHHFSMHLMARMVWSEGDFAMLALNQEHPFWALDKGLIRDETPLHVIAGFQVMHPNPPTLRRQRWKPHFHNLDRIRDLLGWQDWFIHFHHGVLKDELMLQLCGMPVHSALSEQLSDLDNIHWMSKSQFLQTVRQCQNLLKKCHGQRPFYDFLPLSWVRAQWKEAKIDPLIWTAATKQVQDSDTIVVENDRIKLSLHQPEWSHRDRNHLKKLLDFGSAKFPIVDLRDFGPTRAEMEPLVNMLVWERYLISLSADLLVPTPFLNRGLSQLKTHFDSSDQLLQVSDLKDLLGLTRKVAIPLLEYLDKSGHTLREPEGRRWLQAESIQPTWNPPDFLS